MYLCIYLSLYQSMHIIDWEEPSRAPSNAQKTLPTSHHAPAAPSRLPLPSLGVEEPLLTSTVRGSAAVAGDVEGGGPDGARREERRKAVAGERGEGGSHTMLPLGVAVQECLLRPIWSQYHHVSQQALDFMLRELQA